MHLLRSLLWAHRLAVFPGHILPFTATRSPELELNKAAPSGTALLVFLLDDVS